MTMASRLVMQAYGASSRRSGSNPPSRRWPRSWARSAASAREQCLQRVPFRRVDRQPVCELGRGCRSRRASWSSARQLVDGRGADGASPPAGPAARSRGPARRALSRREPGRNSRLPPVVMAQGGSGQRQPVGQPLDRLLGSFAVERHQRSRASGDADEIGAPPVGSDQGRLDDISAVVDGAFVSLSGHGSVGSEYGDFVRSRETTILPPAAGTDQAKEGAKTHPHRPGCWGRYPWFRQKKICPPLLIHTLRTCHAQDFHSAWGSTRRGPRRASCCRDCSPPRPSCSALRTSLCCPGLRGGRRGGLGRTGSRGGGQGV